MIIRTLDDLRALDRIRFPADDSFRSARFVTAADGLGFSYNENRVRAGVTLDVWLKHHWEANLILSGRGTVTDLTGGNHWPLEAGVLYVVGPNDRHRLTFTEDECHVSIFWPPLAGGERFDKDGSYEPSGPVPETGRRMFVRSMEDPAGDNVVRVAAEDGVQRNPLLTEADGIGFSVSELRLAIGAELPLKPGHAYHIVSGNGEVTDAGTGRSLPLAASTLCVPEPEDRLSLMARGAMHVLSMTSS